MYLGGFVAVLEAQRNEGVGIHYPVHEVGAALDHALVDELPEWLLLADISEVIQELVPEAGIYQMSGGMLRASDIEVHIAPVLIRLLTDEGLVIMRVHIPEIVCTASCKARHGAFLYRPAVHIPVLCPAERRLTAFRRQILVHFRKLQRQAVHRHRGGDTVLEIYRERLSPVSLAGEYGVTEPVVDLPVPYTVLLHIVYGSRDCLLDGHSVQEAGVAHDAVLGIE